MDHTDDKDTEGEKADTLGITVFDQKISTSGTHIEKVPSSGPKDITDMAIPHITGASIPI